MGETVPRLEGRRVLPDQVAADIKVEALRLGRSMLEPLGATVFTVGSGLSSVLLPVGHRRLLVLGIPVPVFGYLGEDGLEVHEQALARLKGELDHLLPRGVRLEAQALGPGAVSGYPVHVLRWFPRFHGAGRRMEPPVLGRALVTVFPIEGPEARHWPMGPDWAIQLAAELEDRVPSLYEILDEILVQAVENGGGDRSSPLLE